MVIDSEWQSEFQQVIPAARVLPERHLVRVLRDLSERDLPVCLNPNVPVWVSRTELQTVLDLEPHVLAGDDNPLLLLKSPGDRPGHNPGEESVRQEYQHKLLYAAVWKRTFDKEFTDQQIRERLLALHPDTQDEARFVLEQDDIVPENVPLKNMYSHFVADCWLKLQTDPQTVPWWYPSLSLVENLQDKLWPEGFASPLPPVKAFEDRKPVTPTVSPSDRDAESFIRKGNFARAAIVLATQGKTEEAKAVYLNNVLAKLGLEEPTCWAAALPPLFPLAANSVLNPEKRFLYDLQHIANEYQQELSTLDPGVWMKSLGKKPLSYSLLYARDVVKRQGLARAMARLEKSDIAQDALEDIEHLLEHEITRCDAAIREQITPKILAAMAAGGFYPQTNIETISRDKIAKELLDRICSRGSIRFSDWRDAVARNQLKLDNVASASEWWKGDVLLKTDRELGTALPGIYRTGEAYLRGIHRGSMLAFGTPLGRFLSTYVALPFGGAFLALEFLQHVVHAVTGAQNFFSKVLAPKSSLNSVAGALAEAEEERWWEDFEPNINLDEAANVATQAVTSSGEHHTNFVTLPAVGGLGLFILLLVLSGTFRKSVGHAFFLSWQGIRGLLYDLPFAIWRSPMVLEVRRNTTVKWIGRRCGLSLVFAGVIYGLTTFLGAQPVRALRYSLLVFALFSLLKMLPVARLYEDRLKEWLWDLWRTIRTNLIPGFIGWIIGVFRALVRFVEQVMHRVDEWLRFREGQTAPNLWMKTALAFLWFPLAYVFRFAFYLLLEPQVNPVKHFPVVTVSHKVLYAGLIPLSDATGIPEGVLGTIFTGVPGIFGFLAWELRENWKLYKANTTPTIHPVVLGHHGENARGLLRLGFHSGTIPRLYRKARRKIKTLRRQNETLSLQYFVHEQHHIKHTLQCFLKREMVPLLQTKPAWQNYTPTVEEPEFNTVSITATITVKETPGFLWTLSMKLDDTDMLLGKIETQNGEMLSDEAMAVLAEVNKGILAMVGAKDVTVERSEWNKVWNNTKPA